MVLGSEIESGQVDWQVNPGEEGAAPLPGQAWIPTQQLSEFLHEIRNPITTLQTLAKLLNKRLAPEDRNHWISRSIEQECHHLQDLLSHFEQDLSAPTPLQTMPLDIGAFLQEQRTTLAAIVEDHELSFSLDRLPCQSLLVFAEPLALRQVLGNLIDNACKYTPAGGRVDVGIREQLDAVWIEVCDTGAGIQPEALDQIFTPFFRGNQERPGQGLGLAISRDLVRQMGGDIEVESTPGQGSVFRVCLPLVTRNSAPHSVDLPARQENTDP